MAVPSYRIQETSGCEMMIIRGDLSTRRGMARFERGNQQTVDSFAWSRIWKSDSPVLWGWRELDPDLDLDLEGEVRGARTKGQEVHSPNAQPPPYPIDNRVFS